MDNWSDIEREKRLIGNWIASFKRDENFFLNCPYVSGGFPFGNGEHTTIADAFSLWHLEIRFFELVFCYVYAEAVAFFKKDFLLNATKCFILGYLCNAIRNSNYCNDCFYIEKTFSFFEKSSWKTPFDRHLALKEPMAFVEKEGLGYIVSVLKNSQEVVFDKEVNHYLIWLLKMEQEKYFINISNLCK